MNIDNIILKPILTEKATQLAARNVYMFHVNTRVNKFQIKKALEQLYVVKVKTVAISTRKGKLRRIGKKMIKKKLPDRKVAYVTLREGKLELFPIA